MRLPACHFGQEEHERRLVWIRLQSKAAHLPLVTSMRKGGVRQCHLPLEQLDEGLAGGAVGAVADPPAGLHVDLHQAPAHRLQELPRL